MQARSRDAGGRPAPVLALAPREQGHPEDAELARALLSGEAWAAAAVWNKHAPRVFRVIARVIGPSGDAEDLTQDVFVKVFSSAAELRNPDALGSFILSITLRRLKWHLRSRRVRSILQLSGSGEMPDYPVPGGDSEAREALARLYRILDGLRADERTAFVLRHMEDLTLPEIARTMGLSLATVKRRLSRATEDVSRRAEKDDALADYRRRIWGGGGRAEEGEAHDED